MRNRITVILLLLAAPQFCAAQKPMDGYFIFGQSNANGRSYRAEFTNTVLRQTFGTNIDYAYRERSYSNGSTPVDIPLGPIQPDARERVGVEVTLGRHLSAHSSNPVALIKFCSGGTSITNFLPETDNLFQPMIRYLKGKEAEVAATGYQLKWKGAFVITGESDSTPANAAKFTERFLTIQEALEQELNSDCLPIVYSLLRGHWVDTPAARYSRFNASAEQINADMTALAAHDSSIRVSPDNDDLKTRFENGDSQTDGIHYSSNSYALLGHRLYRTAFPDRSAVIDRNGDGNSDILELRTASRHYEEEEFQRKQSASALGTDSDHDGVSDWAENELEGFDADNDDSFAVGERFSDLPILLSLIDGQTSRTDSVSAVWSVNSPNDSSGKLGATTIDWTGPQHETTVSGGSIVTSNSEGPKPIAHTVTFSEPIETLQVTVSGISRPSRIRFDAAFTVVKNSNAAIQEGNALIGQSESDTSVTLRFDAPVRSLTVTTPGNDAMFFLFTTDVVIPGTPLKWRE